VAYAENDMGDDMDLDSEEFKVERVIAQRTGPNGMHEYLLGWVGYTELNWIPARNYDYAKLIAQFHAVL
jgi:hypothetical protein